jgi:hypothetical protein
MPTLPSKTSAGYWTQWTSNLIRLRDVPLNYNTIFLFHALPVGGAGGTTGAVYWPGVGNGRGANTNFLADLSYVRNTQRRCVILTVGGAFAHIDLSGGTGPGTRAQAFLDSIIGISNDWGGTASVAAFDGLDWNNFEGGQLPNTTEMVWISQQLKQKYGPGFAITAPISASGQDDRFDVDMGFCIAARNAGAFDAVFPQFYDYWDLADPGLVATRVASATTSLGGAQYVGIGFAVDTSGQPGGRWLATSARDCWLVEVGKRPALRGAFNFAIPRDEELGWSYANTVSPAIFEAEQPPAPTPTDPPTVPTSVSVDELLANSLRLNWSAPADDGGGPITSYRIGIQAAGWNNGAEWTTTVSATTTNFTFTNLLPSTQYTVRVAAINAIAQGPYETLTPTTASGGDPSPPDPEPPPDPTGSPTFVGAASNRSFTAALSVGGISALNGDVAFAFVTQNDSGSTTGGSTTTPPTGWTHLATENNGLSYRTSVYRRTLTGDLPPQTWNFAASHWSTVAIVVYRNIEPLVSLAWGTGGWFSSIIAPAVSVPVGGLSVRYAHGHAGGPGSWSGGTLRLNQLAGDAGIAHFGVIETDGANRTYTLSAPGYCRAVSVVLTPTEATPEPVENDPATLDVLTSGNTVTYTWSTPTMAGADSVHLFKRGPYSSEGSVNTEPFDPEASTPFATVPIAQNNYVENDVPAGFYFVQVFPSGA